MLEEGYRETPGAAEQLLVDVALGVVKQKLEDFSRLRVWGEHKERPAHMPAFSSSPLPYVTAIAEHLFSLPEQLDLSGGKDGQEDPGADDSGEKFMQHWVSRIGGELIALYSARVLALAALSPSGRVQLATDLQYLASILATLGAERLPQLQGLRALERLVWQEEEEKAEQESPNFLFLFLLCVGTNAR